jgi:small subunit ribosomal protein S3
MAVGETSGQGERPRRVISAGGGRRRPDQGGPGEAPAAPASDAPEEESKPLVAEVDPELEKILAEEEEIERRTREHHEAPHFKKDDG